MTNLQTFNNNGIEIIIDTVTGESFCSKSGYARLSGKDLSTISRRFERGYKGLDIIPYKTAQVLTAGGVQRADLIGEDIIVDWLPDDNPEATKKLLKLGVRMYLHHVGGYKVTSSATEQQPALEDVDYIKQKLEVAEAIGNVLKRNVPNKSAGEQFAIRMLAKAAPSEYHDILEEAKNLIADEAATPVSDLYTATDISNVLVEKGHTYYSSARKVNQLLKEVGLQDKGTYKGAKWKATTKAKQEDLAKEVVVTVPIKSKKDTTYAPTQLKWKAAIIDYLLVELKS